MLYEVGLPVREEHDALADAEDCRRICKRMAGQCRLVPTFGNLNFLFLSLASSSLTLSLTVTGSMMSISSGTGLSHRVLLLFSG